MAHPLGLGLVDGRCAVERVGMALHGAAQGIAMSLNAADWLHMVLHFLSLSLITFGGVVAAAPDMHRYLVDQQHWLSDPEFNSSITLAQIAPGPNVLFVAIIGWTLGVQAGGGMAAGRGCGIGFARLGLTPTRD